MSYNPGLAAALSGATVRQLSYWRSARSADPLLRPEFYVPRSTVSYSFRDVVALRTFVYLRAQHVSLQRVRKAVRQLRQFGEMGHLSEYRSSPWGRMSSGSFPARSQST
jgi:DNA-binding transcriptional MerR regulator